ncbi:hypothetical protein BDF20DRAFT_838583 [Mycotypha africana]|uniref:uncharacterized protein n=1 Tax=Mycotypha africana TaxID=64632 RepID=UPI0023007FEB|nr:uncharacterized protein BDF20DRAFT_838583 [Mycotypha africana]KAI8970205.1 hypothetical protein BDF20DRAFT_838583 [Mycotypha africana]
MRDWLALPLSPSTVSHTNNEGSLATTTTATTSDDDTQNYDIINSKSANTTSTDGELTENDERPERRKRKPSWFSILKVFGVSNKVKSKSSKARKKLSISNRSNSSATVSSIASSIATTAPEQPIFEERNDSKQSEQAQEALMGEQQQKQEQSSLLVNEIIKEDEGEHIQKQVTQNARTILPKEFGENKASEPIIVAKQEEELQEVEELAVSSSPSLHRNSISSANSSIVSTDVDSDDNSTPSNSQILSAPTTAGNDLNNQKATAETTVYTKVCWNHGGYKVQVTGEFDNWSVSINMIKDTENPNRYFAEIPIPNVNKDMEFKFVVDGEWRYAEELPHRTDWRKSYNSKKSIDS